MLRRCAQRRRYIVADACLLFEDYVEQEWQAGRITVALQRGPATVLLHGHCHQKAMGLMPSARALLARIPSSTVVDLDAGCCGMAGSFGYACEHYDVSRQIGERKLLPAARAMGAERETGTLERGKAADLVVVGDDPTKDIANLRKVRFVMRAGALRPIEELKASPAH